MPQFISSRIRFGYAVAFLATLLCGSVQAAALSSGDQAPGQLLVKLRRPSAGLVAQSMVISSLMRKLGPNSVLDVHRLKTDPSISVIRLAHSSDLALGAAIGALEKDPRVKYAEPNYIVHLLDTGEGGGMSPSGADLGSNGIPDDPDFAQDWGLSNTGQEDPGGEIGVLGADIDILPVWREGYTGSRKIIVAVLDTGIDWNHPDLQANIYTNPGEVAGNGKDDDHNGFIDDVHGWNFLTESPDSMDDHNHGTHCAGVIGAVGNNGIGIAGINWKVSLMPLKFLAADGSGTMDKAVEAIDYAIEMHANVLSNSWGGGGYSQALHDAIARARDAGILFVAAAGNDAHNLDTEPEYPASFGLDNIVTVAATDNRDRLGIFSNYGAQSVDVAAPGVRIWSTIRNGEYGSMSGTSMATPFASGLAALLLSADPGLNYLQVKERLIRTSTPVPALSGLVRANGLLNAYNAIHDVEH